MKRFLLFSGDCYYPGGGWEDFIAAFDTEEAAREYAVAASKKDRWDWWHIVDMTTQKQVESPVA